MAQRATGQTCRGQRGHSSHLMAGDNLCFRWPQTPAVLPVWAMGTAEPTGLLRGWSFVVSGEIQPRKAGEIQPGKAVQVALCGAGKNLPGRAGPDLLICLPQNGAAPQGLAALIYKMHLPPLLHLLAAQMPESSTSMTNVTAPWEGDHCSRAAVQRFIKYIKTSWILSAPLAPNKAEGRTSVRANPQGGTGGWWAWGKQSHCLPLP